MPIYHSVTPTYDRMEQIDLSENGNRVRFTRVSDDMWQYESMREDDTSFVRARDLAPLHTLWHHAMVFFGVIDPDDISHPPA